MRQTTDHKEIPGVAVESEDARVRNEDIREERLQEQSTCTRCGGLLVADECLDVLCDQGEIECQVLRCVQCGDLIDAVILAHRLNRPNVKRKRSPKWSSARAFAAVGGRPD